MSESLFLPLEEDEFDDLKNGKLVQKHYHILKENPTYALFVVLGKCDFNPSMFSKILADGNGVAPITLTNQIIDKIMKKENGLIVKYDDFDIVVISHKYKEFREQNKGLMERE